MHQIQQKILNLRRTARRTMFLLLQSMLLLFRIWLVSLKPKSLPKLQKKKSKTNINTINEKSHHLYSFFRAPFCTSGIRFLYIESLYSIVFAFIQFVNLPIVDFLLLIFSNNSNLLIKFLAPTIFSNTYLFLSIKLYGQRGIFNSPIDEKTSF